MQTDELRAELAELAREVDPFAGDLGTVRRQVARRRIALGSIAIVLSIALVVGVVSATRSKTQFIHIAGTEKEVATADLPRLDAVVALPGHATSSDAARVQAILDGSRSVKSYAPLPAASLAAVMQFQNAGSTALHNRVCADPSTQSFGVELSRPTARAVRGLPVAIAAAATVQFVARPGVDAEVVMNPTATKSQTAQMNARIARDPDVVTNTFVDHQAALREFKTLFAAQPDLIANTTASALPEMFRLELRDGMSVQTIVDRYQGGPGVNIVQTESNELWAHPRLSLHQACTRDP